MLHEFYKLGMLHALEKHAVVGELVRAMPRLAKRMVRKKIVGGAKSELGEALGLTPPSWKSGENLPMLLGIPDVEERLQRALQESLQPEPGMISPEIPPVKLETSKSEKG